MAGELILSGRDQRLAALEVANLSRRLRSDFKRHLRAHPVEALVVLAGKIEDPPEWLETARLHQALMWLPGFGQARVRRMIQGLGAGGMAPSPTATLGSLAPRQRALLTAELRALYEQAQEAGA